MRGRHSRGWRPRSVIVTAATALALAGAGLGAPSVSTCALAQIHEWVFPAVDPGVTTFRTPFVFTPPQ